MKVKKGGEERKKRKKNKKKKKRKKERKRKKQKSRTNEFYQYKKAEHRSTLEREGFCNPEFF